MPGWVECSLTRFAQGVFSFQTLSSGSLGPLMTAMARRGTSAQGGVQAAAKLESQIVRSAVHLGLLHLAFSSKQSKQTNPDLNSVF